MGSVNWTDHGVSLSIPYWLKLGLGNINYLLHGFFFLLELLDLRSWSCPWRRMRAWCQDLQSGLHVSWNHFLVLTLGSHYQLNKYWLPLCVGSTGGGLRSECWAAWNVYSCGSKPTGKWERMFIWLTMVILWHQDACCQITSLWCDMLYALPTPLGHLHVYRVWRRTVKGPSSDIWHRSGTGYLWVCRRDQTWGAEGMIASHPAQVKDSMCHEAQVFHLCESQVLHHSIETVFISLLGCE